MKQEFSLQNSTLEKFYSPEGVPINYIGNHNRITIEKISEYIYFNSILPLFYHFLL